ncbi:MAG: YbaN family protein [Candidatus Methanoplasma sp.]|jgi:uncharacterized membrane protein YbaN (DUF454 family)|nr:YbaN family protein [Candidatus Methanoplasma sp.]
MIIRKALLVFAGLVSLAIGSVGVFLPILPTTPFVLLAAACFASSSPKLYAKLEGTRYFGEYLRNYRDGTGISGKARWTGVAFLWITLTASALAFRHLHVWVVLAIVGVCVTAHILTICKSKEHIQIEPSENL